MFSDEKSNYLCVGKCEKRGWVGVRIALEGRALENVCICVLFGGICVLKVAIFI